MMRNDGMEIANGIEAVQDGRIFTPRSSKLAARRTGTAPLSPARSPKFHARRGRAVRLTAAKGSDERRAFRSK
jgi:hypothetical protein